MRLWIPGPTHVRPELLLRQRLDLAVDGALGGGRLGGVDQRRQPASVRGRDARELGLGDVEQLDHEARGVALLVDEAARVERVGEGLLLHRFEPGGIGGRRLEQRGDQEIAVLTAVALTWARPWT